MARLATLRAGLDGPPVLLMTWLIVPVPPNDTVTRLWNLTPEVAGTSNEWASTTLGLVEKKH